ncbi:ISNCY family transposase [Massilia sp. YIM B02443]|uniref:ISNCY family transposase n=1 Tax=Massilia sp. YIM B02443 TaxID=3050127 RepID=UPI0025B70AD6|nr:ISNCY family transposase [Massilia sp. YIM B02443]MDN4035828.1 ISNCY family transposase [Massilia sp. YIM B02443]
MLMIPKRLGSSVSATGSITVQELERAKVIEAYARGEIKAAVAAFRLQLSTKQVRRLRASFEQDGLQGLVSRRRGRPGNNQLEPGIAQKALQLVRDHYADFGPTLACEMLKERHQVTLSKETLRALMIDAGIWVPRAAKRAGLHQPRERRACLGELVQIDGSRHEWFEERNRACTVLAFVDDATSRILHLQFAETETTVSYFDAMRSYLQQCGKPQAFYADRAAVFRAPAANKHVPTQFQRALDELGIELICANSPQAKGRVERANRTLQDRLVKQLRLEEISDIEAANEWSQGFVRAYNDRFARIPRSPLDLHTPLRKNEDLTLILSLRHLRKLSTQLTLQLDGRKFVLEDVPEARALIGQPIAIHTYRDGHIELRGAGLVLAHSIHEPALLAGPTEVDSKSLHQAVDQVASQKSRRARPYLDHQSATQVSQGVRSAKKMSAEKRSRQP